MTAWAWLAILIASNLTNIIWRGALHRDAPLWTVSARIIILGGLWFAGARLAELRPLRPYLLALIAVLIGLLVKDAMYRVPGLVAWMSAAPWRDEVVMSSVLKLLPVAAMALTVLDLDRRSLFLIRGDLGAPGRIPFTGTTISWTWLGVVLLLVVGGSMAGLMFMAIRPDLQGFRRLLGLLPIIVIFAAINAFSEEFTFRSVLLSRLTPHVGPESALWMTSVRFGLGHWFGNPSGPVGALGATFLGLMLGKSLLETRGFFWAGLIHFTLDVIIFSFLVIASPRG